MQNQTDISGSFHNLGAGGVLPCLSTFSMSEGKEGYVDVSGISDKRFQQVMARYYKSEGELELAKDILDKLHIPF
jgi:hypothetical protein